MRDVSGVTVWGTWARGGVLVEPESHPHHLGCEPCVSKDTIYQIVPTNPCQPSSAGTRQGPVMCTVHTAQQELVSWKPTTSAYT